MVEWLSFHIALESLFCSRIESLEYILLLKMRIEIAISPEISVGAPQMNVLVFVSLSLGYVVDEDFISNIINRT